MCPSHVNDPHCETKRNETVGMGLEMEMGLEMKMEMGLGMEMEMGMGLEMEVGLEMEMGLENVTDCRHLNTFWENLFLGWSKVGGGLCPWMCLFRR